MKVISRTKNIVLKYEKIFILLMIVIAVAAFSFNILVDANDELWNFSNIYKMTNGEVIYQDCNVIVTPLFFYIGIILFKILGANLLTFRIYNLIIYTALYYLIYLLFRKMKVSTVRTITYLILTYFITFRTILLGANYNMLALVFVILGILNIIKEKKNTIKDNIIQGVLVFAIFMCKQNIGFFYVAGLIIYDIVSRKNTKQIMKDGIIQFIAFIIPLIIYIIYLYINNNLYNFINYTILGLKEFKNYNLLYDFSIYILIIELFICIFIALYIIKNRKKLDETFKTNSTALTIFSIAMLGIAYPIFNANHTIMASIIFIITIFYFIDKRVIEEKFKNKNINGTLKTINTICITVMISLSIGINYSYLSNIKENPYKPYYGGIIKKEMQEEIAVITSYIQEKEKQGIDVKVISYKANLYMNVLNKNNEEMDLAFYGNLGKGGEDELIEKIKKLKDTHILISKGEIEYQESKKVKDYIIQNLEQIGEIEEFYIYETIN